LSTIISTDGTFSEQHKELLALLSDMMIPANGEYPSAAAAEIFPRTLERLSAHESIVLEALAQLEDLARKNNQASFSALGDEQRRDLIAEFKSSQMGFIQVLQASVITSYYQDDRVLQALGLPARSPHPGGYEVTATDWSLLDPVRDREPFYRTPER
jgi:hypothetical protein